MLVKYGYFLIYQYKFTLKISNEKLTDFKESF